MKFKTELVLLFLAIGLFVVSTVMYSYAKGNSAFILALVAHPYRGYAIAIAGFGSVLMAVATVSYSKRSRNCP